jgi:hypothetical protein
MFAPTNFAPLQALLFGHFRACGGPNERARELLALVGVGNFRVDAVWLKFFERMLAAPELAPHQVRPLADYVAFKRFRCEERERFSLSAHSIPALLTQMGRWHAALRGANFRYASGVDPNERWASRIGAPAFEGTWEQGEYVIAELRSFQELFEEGQRMHHCVASYAQAAARGHVSLWCLRLQHQGREVGRVTIRVTLPQRQIVEARRFANARIQPHELDILTRWAARSGLSVAPGL